MVSELTLIGLLFSLDRIHEATKNFSLPEGEKCTRVVQEVYLMLY